MVLSTSQGLTLNAKINHTMGNKEVLVEEIKMRTGNQEPRWSKIYFSLDLCNIRECTDLLKNIHLLKCVQKILQPPLDR